MEVKSKNQTDYAAIYRMSQTKGWGEINRALVKDSNFFTRLLKTRKPSTTDSTGKSVRGEFITDSHDVGHARGALEIVDKILNLVTRATREVEIIKTEEE